MYRRNQYFSILTTLVLIPSLAHAEDAMTARADIDGNGQNETVSLRQGTNERHLLVVDNRETEHGLPSARVSADQGDAELRTVSMARNRRAAIYRAPLVGDGLAFEALLVGDQRGSVTVVWAGVTGFRGDRGTRWGDRVIVDDLDGDGHDDILIASVAEEVPLCGVDHPELFPRALDPNSGRLRPVLLNRLRHLQVDEVQLEASRTNPGTQGPTPLIQVTSLAVASTNAGDRGTVEGLAAPRAVADGDPATAWVEGRPGPGTWDFISARLLPGPYLVQTLALTLAPAPADDDSPELGRLRTFTILLQGAQGLRRFLVTVPEDPASYPGEPVWVQLPEPVSASCLSVVLGEVFGGRRVPSSTAIAELQVFTDLDFEGGRERLMEALREGTADVEVVLRALGEGAVPLLNEQWSELDPGSRRRATRVLADLEVPSGAPLLADAALSSDSRAASVAREGLIALGDAGLEALAEGLEADDAERRGRAAQLIGNIGTLAAADRLVQRAQSGPPDSDQPALARALAQTLRTAGPQARTVVLEGIESAPVRSRQVLLASLIPVEAEEREVFERAVADLWQQASSFDDRFRVLRLAGGAGLSEGLLQLISTALINDEDRYLRAHAAEVLGSMGEGITGEDARSIIGQLAAGADDEWTGVRLVVAHSLGRVDPVLGSSTLSTLLSDSWPVVRAAALGALARAGIEGGALTPLASALSDRSHIVQVMAARLLGGLGSPTTLEPLLTLARNDDQHIEARRAATRAIGRLCSSQAQSALLELLTTGTEARRTEDQARIAAEAAGTLAAFPAPAVGQLLVQAAGGGPVGLRLAAIESLGLGNHPGALETLQALTEDPNPPLRAAAAAALRNLEMAHDRRTCPR